MFHGLKQQSQQCATMCYRVLRVQERSRVVSICTSTTGEIRASRSRECSFRLTGLGSTVCRDTTGPVWQSRTFVIQADCLMHVLRPHLRQRTEVHCTLWSKQSNRPGLHIRPSQKQVLIYGTQRLAYMVSTAVCTPQDA